MAPGTCATKLHLFADRLERMRVELQYLRTECAADQLNGDIASEAMVYVGLAISRLRTAQEAL